MRLEGWEGRLYAVLAAARARPYELGEHDCFRLTCRVLDALTGVDRWGEFAGQYRTKRQALALLAAHGGTFEDAFDWFFGQPRAGALSAHRGDVVALRTDDGEKHLGVCDGVRTAFLAPAGLIYLPTRNGLCCWRV